MFIYYSHQSYFFTQEFNDCDNLSENPGNGNKQADKKHPMTGGLPQVFGRPK